MARTGLIRRLRGLLRGRDRREPGRVNHVALGNHCHMAQILKETRLRSWSGPFDWIFSSPGMVRDCLADDFCALLDRAQYRSTPLGQRPAPKVSSCRHDLYAERYGIPYVFNHHDPAAIEADYRFLEAGVRRLRAALALREAENRFYVLATRPTPDDDILGLAEALAAHGPNNRLAVIQTMPGREAGVTVPVASPHPHLTWLRVATASDSLGLRFADPADEAALRRVVRGLAANP